MSEPSSTPGEPAAGLKTTGLAAWASPRRKRFWVVALLLLYTLLGFFAVPPLVRSLAVDALWERTGREATIGQIRFNPFVLSLEVNAFELRDTDGERLAAFDRLFVNFQASSLFRWAWTFREFRLDGLFYLFERFAPQDSRLIRLLADVEARAEPAPGPEEPSGLPRLLIQELGFGEGRVQFRDDVPTEPVDLEFGPVSVSVRDLNTLPERYGQQTVRIGLPGGAALSWQGDISLAPLRSEGTLELRGSHLQQTTAYLKAVLPLESLEAELTTDTRYTLSEAEDGSVSVALDDLRLIVEDVAVTGLQPSAEFLTLGRLEFGGGSLRYPARSLRFARVELLGLGVDTWLDESGEPNLLQLVPRTDPAPDSAGSSAEQAAPWQVTVDSFQLRDGRIDFADRSIEPQAKLRLRDLALELQQLGNAAGAEFPLSLSGALDGGGGFGFEGRLAVLPDVSLQGSATARAIPLALAQPYIEQSLSVRIDEGTLESRAELSLRPDASFAASGDVAIAELSVNDTREDRALFGWTRFSTDRFEFDSASQSLDLSRLTFEEPYGRLTVNADRTTNLSGLMRESSSAPDPSGAADEPTATDAEAPPLDVVVGGVTMRNGALDFSDLSLPLPFATEIRELGGTISTVDTQSAEPANVRLEGKVDTFGLARIEGALNLLDPVRSSDLTMEFRNLKMSNLSPYTAEFAGREIAEGKLDLKLEYVLDNGLMKGRNDIVMSDLILGDKVDHPGAASLPLDLAVALLKDANGVIDIELAVEGDVNDPEFKIGGVVWKALVGLVTKIVTAPFRLLGNLVGADSEDFGAFQFLGGRADLAPPELEQIGLLREALAKRPELSVEISGVYVAEIDTPALQYQRLRAEIIARVGEGAAADAEDFRMLDEALRATLETLFTDRFPDTPLASLRALHTAPPDGDPQGEPVFDALAYAADLRDRLLAAEDISQADLEDLANARARAIQDAFLASGEFDPARVTILAPEEAESEDDEWVIMELGVGTN